MVTAKGCARVLKGDGAHLADCELLEFLPCALIPRVDVEPIAKELIANSARSPPCLARRPSA